MCIGHNYLTIKKETNLEYVQLHGRIWKQGFRSGFFSTTVGFRSGMRPFTIRIRISNTGYKYPLLLRSNYLSKSVQIKDYPNISNISMVCSRASDPDPALVRNRIRIWLPPSRKQTFQPTFGNRSWIRPHLKIGSGSEQNFITIVWTHKVLFWFEKFCFKSNRFVPFLWVFCS